MINDKLIILVRIRTRRYYIVGSEMTFEAIAFINIRLDNE